MFSRKMFDVKRCPKCGRFMVKDRVEDISWNVLLDEEHSTGVIFWCLCGHTEEANESSNTAK